MEYKAREADGTTAELINELEPVVRGLGFALVELDLFRHKQSAQVRLVVTTQPDTGGERPLQASAGGVGTDELTRVHRAVLPRLELSLAGRDLFVEVSSPGIDRLIKDGAEFRHFTGRRIQCWLKGADDWTRGILAASDEVKITLETADGIQELNYERIAKAKLGNEGLYMAKGG